MEIQYTYRSIITFDDTKSYWGVGSVESFGIGLSTTSHIGTFTNTSDLDILGPIFVVAAMTDKSIKSASKMNKIISEHQIPVNTFFFIPSSAQARWYMSSTDGNFWASLPTFTLLAGKTYDGYYIPLSALPPFSSRSEIGAVTPSYETIHYSDFFYLSAAYFDPNIDSFANRVTNGKKVLLMSGDDASSTNTRVRNASSFKTFNSMLYDEAEKTGIGATPKLNIQMKSLNEKTQNGVTFYIPEFVLSTTIPDKSTIGLNDVNLSLVGRHGVDTVGNSGFTNNKDISQDSITTELDIPTDLKSITINKDVRVVSSIDYLSGGVKRVNMYVPM